MSESEQITPSESAAKFRLDHAEFIERRPSLQREVATANFNEDGGLVLVIPPDPDVNAFIKQLAAIEREPAPDLKTARRCLRKARDDYQLRVSMRLPSDREYYPKFRRMVSLSAILIVRAEAMHWHSAVIELENEQQRKRRDRWLAERSAEARTGLAIGAAIKRAVTP